MLEKLTAGAELHHDIKVVVIAEKIDELDNAWVMELLDNTALELKSRLETTCLEMEEWNNLACKQVG
jgi:hypothetical protein